MNLPNPRGGHAAGGNWEEKRGRWSQAADPSQLFALLTVPGFDAKHLAQGV